MRPEKLYTKIFLDSGDPQETREALALLGFLDGQTTNPTLIAKHPATRAKVGRGEKFEPQEILDFYRSVVAEISRIIPVESVSVEVYADKNTSAEQMFEQGKRMFGWIPNAHIKYPITAAGLAAAERSIQEGIRVNMTLCFSQEQAAAVYAATRGAAPGDVFVSPFIGRLDDIGITGMDLVENIARMYQNGDGHVQVLAASVRLLNHFLQSIVRKADSITAPLSILKEWAERGMPVVGSETADAPSDLRAIPYQQIDLDKKWNAFDIKHERTDKGLQKFADDWNALIR